MSGFAAEELACRRGGRTIFTGLSFSVRRGGALLLLGPNGSGKTTLLRCLAGLVRPANGALFWDGARVEEDFAAHRRRLARTRADRAVVSRGCRREAGGRWCR